MFESVIFEKPTEATLFLKFFKQRVEKKRLCKIRIHEEARKVAEFYVGKY